MLQVFTAALPRASKQHGQPSWRREENLMSTRRKVVNHGKPKAINNYHVGMILVNHFCNNPFPLILSTPFETMV